MNGLYKIFIKNRHYYIGILCCVLTIVILCKLLITKPQHKLKYRYKAYFTSAVGLKPDTPIVLNGYKVGSISKIFLDDSYNPVAILNIDQQIAIPDDSSISVKDNSLLGDKVLQLNPGVSEDILLNNGVIMYTNSGLPLFQLIDVLMNYIEDSRKLTS